MVNRNLNGYAMQALKRAADDSAMRGMKAIEIAPSSLSSLRDDIAHQNEATAPSLHLNLSQTQHSEYWVSCIRSNSYP